VSDRATAGTGLDGALNMLIEGRRPDFRTLGHRFHIESVESALFDNGPGRLGQSARPDGFSNVRFGSVGPWVRMRGRG